jgi:hypothetical protein
MRPLPAEVMDFFYNQGYVIVSTIGPRGYPHTACKGIVSISPSGEIYLFDLYKGATSNNLRRDSRMSITAVEEHKFKGYSLRGIATIKPLGELSNEILKDWEAKIVSRLTRRLIRNLKEEKGHPRHPEAQFPRPEYMILFQTEEIVDLKPRHIE